MVEKDLTCYRLEHLILDEWKQIEFEELSLFDIFKLENEVGTGFVFGFLPVLRKGESWLGFCVMGPPDEEGTISCLPMCRTKTFMRPLLFEEMQKIENEEDNGNSV